MVLFSICQSHELYMIYIKGMNYSTNIAFKVLCLAKEVLYQKE